MNRKILILALACAATSASAQVASLKATLDLHLVYQQLGSEQSTFHTYTPQGQFSLFVLTAQTYQGFKIYVSQPLERVSNDPDRDSLQNYYIEDPGVWRVGKQFMKFGAGEIIRDNALAVRSDQVISNWGLPISVIACSSGRYLPTGVIVNIGGNYGVSVAVGENFSISTTSLLNVRLASDSPGLGNGYRRIYDAWYRVNVPHYQYWIEAAALRQGNSALATDDFVSSTGVTFFADANRSFTFSISHDSAQRADFFALASQFKLSKNVSLSPFVRFKNGNMFDASLSLNIQI